MKMLDPEMTNSDSGSIFQAISGGSAEVSQEVLLEHLKKHNIGLSGLKVNILNKSVSS